MIAVEAERRPCHWSGRAPSTLTKSEVVGIFAATTALLAARGIVSVLERFERAAEQTAGGSLP